jgi:hypothetical protein
MTQWDKFRRKLLSGQADKNISFSELCRYVERLGFAQRPDGSGGSHKVYDREDITEIINLQPSGNLAKSYQVKQVRHLIEKYVLREPEN